MLPWPIHPARPADIAAPLRHAEDVDVGAGADETQPGGFSMGISHRICGENFLPSMEERYG